MTDAELFRRARNVVMERGWTQGRYNGADGTVCVVGALMAAAPNLHIGEALQIACQEVGGNVTVWNDAHGRSIHEVLDLFDKCEKIAERECA